MVKENNLNQEEKVALKQAELLWELKNESVWNEVLKPWLLDKGKYVRIDPKEIVNLGGGAKDEYLWRSLVRDVYLGVVKEIIDLVEESEKIAESLRKKAKGEITEKDFSLQ